MTEEISSENNEGKFTHVLMIELDYVIVNLREIEYQAILWLLFVNQNK